MARAPVLAALLVMLAPASASPQMFFGSRPSPDLRVGPVFVQATLQPGTLDVTMDVIFSTVIPPTRSPLEFEQDLFLLWPGSLARQGRIGAPDPALAREVESKGLAVIDEGRLPLFARLHYESSEDVEPIPGGAPFVTAVTTTGPFGLSGPATYIRVPWSPRLANRAWLVGVRLVAERFIQPRPQSWFTRTFHGPRFGLTLAFNDVGPPAMFAMYFWQRDRVLAVADPARLVANFTQADILTIDEVRPAGSLREMSASLEDTETVSLILSRLEGLTPQSMTIQFGYVSGLQAWAAIWVPLAFFALGNLAGVLLQQLARSTTRRLAGRVLFARLRGLPRPRRNGVILSAEQLGRIRPGQSTHAEVLAICGSNVEETRQLDTPERKQLVYRGSEELPQSRWTFAWLTAVSHWDVHDHEVEITVDGGIVRDVQARTRRRPLPRPAAAQ